MRDAVGSSPSLFVDAVDIPRLLEAERGISYRARLRRDRAIGAALAAQAPLQRVRAWRAQMARQGQLPVHDSLGQRLQRARRVIALLMMIVGSVAGCGVAAAVFHYDGTWPVNVVTVVAVLVLLQIALVLLSLVLMLPRVPGVRALQELLGALNPGAFVAAIHNRITRLNEHRAELLEWPVSRGPAVARFARWQMLVWSQIGAIAFNAAALATAAALIAFTDLAFGWSTTLRLDSDDVLRLTSLLAAPWTSIWPEAVPSAPLIESSRFFRLASAPPPAISAEALTGWWPFLLAAMLTYGLVPRCVLLFVALLRLRLATARLLLDDPNVRALLDRMSAPEVALGSEDVEISDEGGDRVAARLPASTAGEAAAVIWSGAISQEKLPAWSLRHLQQSISFVVEAGGGRELQEDKAAIRALAATKPRVVLVFVRGWEAPLLDLQDFLESLRDAVGIDCSIVVVPVGHAEQLANETQRLIWARWVGRIGDSALYMESGA